MNEHEKRIRLRAGSIAGGQLDAADRRQYAGDIGKALDALLAEHRAAMSSARDAALEEAKALAARIRDAGTGILKPDAPKDMRDILAGGTGALNTFITEATDLQSQPASVVPVERVREEARKAIAQDMPGLWRLGVAALADALGANVDDDLPDPLKGVDLDATPAKPRPPPATCTVCGTEHYIADTCPWPERNSE